MRMKGETFPLLIIEAQSVMLIMPPRSYPFPNTRSRTYPQQLYLTRRPPLSLSLSLSSADSLTRLSPFRHQRPFCDTEPARYRL